MYNKGSASKTSMWRWTFVRPPACVSSHSFDDSCRHQKGSTPAKAAAPESAEYLLEARFLDATGVLVGQSDGMNAKSSFITAHPKLETTKIGVSESVDDPESYGLTSVSREETVRARIITRTQGNAIVIGVVAFRCLP